MPIRPPVVVPTSDADYAPLIQAFVDQDFDVIVAAGFNLVPATAAAAKANPDIWFIGVDHAPCINATGDVDPTFADCSGDLATLLPKYIAISYAEDQAGYLAGIVAGLAIQSPNIIGAIGGVSLCGPCIRYIQGYELGAKSVNPDIDVKVGIRLGQRLPGSASPIRPPARRSASSSSQQNAGIDVLFQVAGLTGNGIIDAACAAKHRRHRRRRRPARVVSRLGGLHPDQRREEARDVRLATRSSASPTARPRVA